MTLNMFWVMAIGFGFLMLAAVLTLLLAPPTDPDRPYDWKGDPNKPYDWAEEPDL